MVAILRGGCPAACCLRTSAESSGSSELLMTSVTSSVLRLSLTAISAASFLSRANRMIFAIVARLAVAPDGGLPGALRLLDTPTQGGEAGNPALDHVAAQQRQCSDMSLCCTVTHLHCSGWLVATPSSKGRW